MTISRQFYETAMRNQNKVAIIQGHGLTQRQITYSGLLSLVQQQAHILRLNGLKRHDHIMVQLTGIDFVVILLAAADSGICIVPLGKDAMRETVGKAYQACDCKFLISEGFEPVAEGVNSVRLKFQGQQDDRLLIITTSGSTGDPKPILLKQKTKLARVEMMNELYSCTADDVTLVSTPLHHSMGQRLALMSALKGGTLVLMDGWSVERWHELVREHEVTFAVPVASQVKQIVAADEYLPTMRCMVSSSALLDAPNIGTARRGYPLFNCYGTTEVSIATSTDSTTPPGSVGKPINGVTISFAGGEILVKTPLLFDGYHNRTDLTETAMTADGYFKTGDIGSDDANGCLYYLGRIKELINVGGTKVYPQDVECVVSRYPAVIECAAFPQTDDALGEVVALAIVLSETDMQAAALFDWTREMQKLCLPFLTDEQLPRAVRVTTEPLPRTETGKLQRGKLAEKFGGVK